MANDGGSSSERVGSGFRHRYKGIGAIELFFYRYGLMIARYPLRCIFICLSLVLISSFGLMWLRQEKNPLKLWIPPNSDFKKDSEWIMETFKEGFRSQYVLIEAPNVLDPQVLGQLEKIRRKILQIKVNNVTYEEACFRVPAVKPSTLRIFDFIGRRKKRSFFFFGKDDPSKVSELGFDPSLYLASGAYCAIVNRLPRVCLEVNLPQMWSNDENEIEALTKEDIILKLNETTHSPSTGHAINFPELLGGISRDDQGRIVGARSLLSIWMTHVNFSDVDMDQSGNDAGTSDWATIPILNWEKGFIELLEEESINFSNSSITLYYEAGRSFGDVSSKSMFQDMGKLIIGNILMFFFIQIVLPARLNIVETRFWLGCVGLSCVFLSFIVAVSFCSILGIPYGPVHTSLPFLLLGIGVDDMFVITACWNNLTPKEKSVQVDKQVAMALKHAGVSITITSATDIRGDVGTVHQRVQCTIVINSKSGLNLVPL